MSEHEPTQSVVEEIGARVVRWTVGGLPIVVADETMMRQVWQNLLSNAVKYTARRDEARIEVGIDRSDNSEIVFFVRDNGTGFDMESEPNPPTTVPSSTVITLL